MSNAEDKNEPIDIAQLRKDLAADIDDLVYQVNPVNRIKDSTPRQRILVGATVAVVTATVLLAVLYRRK